jgi:FAD/FMN-containing dehydrogenase
MRAACPDERMRGDHMNAQSLSRFRESFAGEVIVPGSSRYESARRVWNAMIDRRPAMIACCSDAADVARALAFARGQDLAIALRGGAHNVAGNATVDDGVVIDLSGMKSIAVDVAGARAVAGPGLTWGEFDQATTAHGLATTGGLVSTTGIAGFTLGGGIGWLMRKHGLTCDNLVRAEMITADGVTLAASETEHPDLFWALRGGGGNFGVVTRFEYRLHPVSTVIGGLTLYPASRARDALRFFRELTDSAPDELTTLFAFLTAPPAPFVPPALQGKPAVAIVACYAGDPPGGEAAVQPIKRFDPSGVDLIGPMPYTALQSMLDAGAPAGCMNYWKSSYLDRLDDAAIDTIVEHAAGMGAPLAQIHLHHMGGAVARVPAGATAFAHRRSAYAVNIVAMWMDAAENDRYVAWARRFSDAMEPHANGGVYVNFLGNEGEARVRAAYGDEAYTRLRRVKAQYDPDNAFRLNQNIAPATA